MAWYDNAVFYHIYPLGLCGCAHENDGQAVPGAFNKLNAWAEHAADIGCTAIYIGPLFESGSHGYDTIDYRLVDRRLGTNAEFKDFVARCHARGQKVIVDGVFNHVGRDFFAFQDLKANRENARYKDWFCDVNFWGNNEYNDGFMSKEYIEAAMKRYGKPETYVCKKIPYKRYQNWKSQKDKMVIFAK